MSSLTPLLVYSVILNITLAMPGNLAYALKPYLEGEKQYVFIDGKIAPVNPGGFTWLLAGSMYMFNLSILSIILTTSIIYVLISHRDIGRELGSLLTSLEHTGLPRPRCLVTVYVFLVIYYTVVSTAIYILIGAILSYILTVFASAPYIPVTISVYHIALVSMYFTVILSIVAALVVRA